MAEKVNILNIKEIFYEHGKIKFRYSRYLSADGTKWIRHGFMNLTKMVIFFRQKIMKIFYFRTFNLKSLGQLFIAIICYIQNMNI